MTKISDTLLVAIDFHDPDHGVLVVGRKMPGQAVKIVNAFQDEEALELYKKLVTKRRIKNETGIRTCTGIRRYPGRQHI